MSGADVDEMLDAGYVPPDRDPSGHFGETPWEESHGETPRPAHRPGGAGDLGRPREGRDAAGPRRAPRRVDDAAVESGGNDMFAVDEGISGGGASAEEAAVRIVEEPDV